MLGCHPLPKLQHHTAPCCARSPPAARQVIAHMMPDLPNVGWERDVESLREFFENPAFRTDGLKLYPTLVIRGTGLYELWKKGLYKNYAPDKVCGGGVEGAVLCAAVLAGGCCSVIRVTLCSSEHRECCIGSVNPLPDDLQSIGPPAATPPPLPPPPLPNPLPCCHLLPCRPQLVDLVARLLVYVPPWVRIYRIQRDIPMPLVSSGVEKGNLRELALARMGHLGLKCRDVRTRECGIQDIHHKVSGGGVENSVRVGISASGSQYCVWGRVGECGIQGIHHKARGGGVAGMSVRLWHCVSGRLGRLGMGVGFFQRCQRSDSCAAHAQLPA